MDLRSSLLALLAPTAPGDEIIPGVRLLGASVDAGLGLDFAVAGGGLHIDVAPADEPGPAAARSPRLRFSYRGDERAGLATCRAVAALAAANEAAVLAALAAAGEREVDGARVRELRVAQLLEPIAPGHFTLSPYVGCLIGCRFCWAQSGVRRVRRLSRLPEVPWGSFADVRINAAEVLADELPRLRPALVQFCPLMSDPYHALERRYRVTRTCLEVLARAAAPPAVLILTRAAGIAEDAALLARLPRVWAGVSLPTIDDAVRARFEPRAASVAERLATLDALRAAGVRTFAVVQPLLPGDVAALADALAPRVSSVRVDVLHGEEAAGVDFDAYPDARGAAWQAAQATAIAEALGHHRIPLWRGELPPDF
jgi:DNA repair photolyase